MSISVKWWSSVVSFFVKKLRVYALTSALYSQPNLCEYLSGFSIDGYELHLYCQKKHYQRPSFLGFPRNYAMYSVYSIVTNDAPERLKEAAQLEIEIPSMIPFFVSEKLQKEMAIHAYLDILIGRLED